MDIRARESASGFDGIICIGGEDWWYHNRGHFDFQIMRRLAKDRPVLFVNSLAVRMPSIREKGRFAAKIARKVKSLARGLVRVENKFWVYSPLSVPGANGQMLPYAVQTKTASGTGTTTTKVDPATLTVLSPTAIAPSFPVTPALSNDAAVRGVLTEVGSGAGTYQYQFPIGGFSQDLGTSGSSNGKW